MGPHLVVLVVQQLDLLFSLLTFLSQDFWGPSGVPTPSYPPPEEKKRPQAHMLQAHLEIAPFAQLVGCSTSQMFEAKLKTRSGGTGIDIIPDHTKLS